MWGKGNSCPAFQFLSPISLFKYWGFAALLTHVLPLGPKSEWERRELNKEKLAIKLISPDLESLPASTYVCDLISVE